MKAMILAAGLGTRLRPLTDTVPKALVNFCGTPLLGHCILKLVKSGATDIIVNVHHHAELVKKYIAGNNFDANVVISDESDFLLDTGGGLKKAAWFFEDGKPFIVHNVDILCGADLKSFYNHHCRSGMKVSLLVKERKASRYILFDEQNFLRGWMDTRTGERLLTHKAGGELRPLAFSGIHITSSEILSMITEEGKFSLTDLYLRLAENVTIEGIPDESYFFDLGRPEKLAEAEKYFEQHEKC